MILTLSFIIFLTAGIVLFIASGKVVAEMDKACGPNGSNSIAKSFNELYTNADTIYCKTSGGCVCYSSDPALVNGGTIVGTETSSTVIKVQEWITYLEAAFANYGISFSGIGEIQKYLDYFGEIEKAYKCSGICTVKAIYYFSSIGNGIPKSNCFSSIRNKLILGDIRNYGIGYIVTGVVLFVIWFIQYGLCCRKNQNARRGATKQF